MYSCRIQCCCVFHFRSASMPGQFVLVTKQSWTSLGSVRSPVFSNGFIFSGKTVATGRRFPEVDTNTLTYCFTICIINYFTKRSACSEFGTSRYRQLFAGLKLKFDWLYYRVEAVSFVINVAYKSGDIRDFCPISGRTSIWPFWQIRLQQNLWLHFVGFSKTAVHVDYLQLKRCYKASSSSSFSLISS